MGYLREKVRARGVMAYVCLGDGGLIAVLMFRFHQGRKDATISCFPTVHKALMVTVSVFLTSL